MRGAEPPSRLELETYGLRNRPTESTPGHHKALGSAVETTDPQVGSGASTQRPIATSNARPWFLTVAEIGRAILTEASTLPAGAFAELTAVSVRLRQERAPTGPVG
jgi:hypothetical protein